MMELNCTYQQSKEILELGFDFEKVCDRFIEELSRLKKPEYIEQECFQITVFRTEINQRMSDCLIPIIPLAALEKCLPDYSFIDAANRKLSCRWYGHIPICNEAYALNNIHLHHKSAYEAFMWVNEHYPEQLKTKFSEVMNEKTI
jgi:hypothetical protein